MCGRCKGLFDTWKNQRVLPGLRAFVTTCNSINNLKRINGASILFIFYILHTHHLSNGKYFPDSSTNDIFMYFSHIWQLNNICHKVFKNITICFNHYLVLKFCTSLLCIIYNIHHQHITVYKRRIILISFGIYRKINITTQNNKCWRRGLNYFPYHFPPEKKNIYLNARNPNHTFDHVKEITKHVFFFRCSFVQDLL